MTPETLIVSVWQVSGTGQAALNEESGGFRIIAELIV